MDSRLKKYLYSVVYPYIINKYNIFNIKDIPNLNSLTLEVVLQDFSKDNFLEILNIFFFIERLTGQRPYIKKFISKHYQKKKVYYLVLLVNLRKDSFFNFLEYLINFVFLGLKFNNMKLNYSITSNNVFCFSFSNFNFFLGLPEELKNIKCKLKFNIFFSLGNKVNSIRIIQDILYHLNFFNEVFKRKK